MWENVGFYPGWKTFACKVKVVVLFDLAQKHKSYLRYICLIYATHPLNEQLIFESGLFRDPPLLTQNFRIFKNFI